MRFRKHLASSLALMLLGVALFTSCKKKDDEQSPAPEVPNTSKTITQLAVDNGFDSLAVALTKTGLITNFDDNNDPKSTVFAPTNTAFVNLLKSLGLNRIADVSNDVLKEILLYHVVNGQVLSSSLSEGMIIKTLSGNTLRASLSDGAKLYTKSTKAVKISSVDIVGSNGVIHVVDEVLVQDAPGIPGNSASAPTKTIAQTAIDAGFDSLVVALTRLNLVSTFSDSKANYTVFAPTNDAFVNLCTTLNVNSIAEIDEATLTSTIQFHAVDGIISSSQLVNNQTIKTLNTSGINLMVDLTSGAKLKDVSNGLSSVTTADVWCTNGTIHIIDRVLLPIALVK